MDMSVAEQFPVTSERITPEEQRAHEFIVLEHLVDRALPDGVSEATFGVHVPLDSTGRISVKGYDLGEEMTKVPTAMEVTR